MLPAVSIVVSEREVGEHDARRLRKATSWEMTMLTRPFKGRNFGGMDSHVLRPMRTAFIAFRTPWLPVAGVVLTGSAIDEPSLTATTESNEELLGRFGKRLVTRAKNARSAFRGGQGSVPRRPMPKEGVVATTMVKGGSCGIEAGMGWVGLVMVPGAEQQACNCDGHVEIYGSSRAL